MSQQAEHRIGTVIGGKWRVDDLLGSGSMAAVYAVTHRNGARAALKILHPTLCADPGVCERFLGEGYLTNSVKHPGIVRVLDDGVTDDGCVFLVMDLLEGMTLEALRQERGGRIELREVLDIGDKLMDVLHAVHEAGIIHRDLKPQNVFVCDDGSVKLLDFGVARVLESGAQSKLSAFGLVLGTPSFMSPEQAIGARDKVDHRSDIWSLGATLFTSLTGQTVHLGPNPQARLLAAAKMNARSIGMVRQDLPPQVAAAIDMALRFRKEDRWQSVDAFRRAFREARAQLGWALPEEPPAAPSWLVSQEAPALGAVPPAPPADRGERALALMVRANANADPRRSRPDDDPFDDRRPQAKTVRMGSLQPFAGVDVGPHGAVRTPPSGGLPMRRSVPSAPEGSYPAASSTVDAIGLGARPRRSRAGVWIAALLLVTIAASGIGFFAVKRSGAQGHAPEHMPEHAPEHTNEVAPTTAPLPAVSVAPSAMTATGSGTGLTIATPPALTAPPGGEGMSGATREVPGTNEPASGLGAAASSVRTARAQSQAPAAPRKAEPPPRAPARLAPVPPSTNRSASEATASQPGIPPDPFATPE